MVLSVDITERKNRERWKYFAYHNDLTSLPNRRMLDLSIDSYIIKVNQKQLKMPSYFLTLRIQKKY